MSKYKTTIWELAKKLGQPTTEFLDAINSFGFEFKSHMARLTQEDLDAIMLKLYPKTDSGGSTNTDSVAETEPDKVLNPGAVIMKRGDKYVCLLVSADTAADGSNVVSVVYEYIRDSKVEALVKYDQLRLKYNMDSTFDS